MNLSTRVTLLQKKTLYIWKQQKFEYQNFYKLAQINLSTVRKLIPSEKVFLKGGENPP